VDQAVASPVATHRDREILVVASDNPPVNALSAAVRRGLLAAVRAAAADDAVKAVVILGRGRTFFAGADISEFGKPPVAPWLPAVVDAIEHGPKPVVAAIHGTALGGGLEVALGAHYRLATRSAKLGLPEVKLGLLPGAGGTQRLPRVIGVAAALSMIVSGDPIPADKALALGLVDLVVDEDALEAEAIAFARRIAGDARPVSSQRTDRIAATDPDVFARFRQENARKPKGFEAPAACIEAIEAAVALPFAEGAKRERALFERLVAGTQSKALRHVFFAERAAAKIDDLPADTPRLPTIDTVGVLGAGTMGGGIAMCFLSAGLPVTLVERDQAALDRGVAHIRKTYEASAKRGRMDPAQVEAALARLTPSLDYDDLRACDLLVEAVFEDLEVKKAVFSRLDATAKPDAILATNTSYLPVDAIAAATCRPQDVVGLHFFSPANVMRLLEVVRAEKTSPATLATAMAVSKRIGKVAVVAGVCDGFIGNRLLKVRRREAERMLLQGATPWAIDQVLLDFGFPMGEFQISDLAGLDLGWNPETSTGSTLREALCELGRRGQKTGKGYYDYDDQRNRTPSPEAEAVIAAFAARSGQTQRAIDGQEILERLLYPMINEAALILEECIAQRASDIDTVWINGYGWPAWTGGPMFWADTLGLARVVEGLERHAAAMSPGLRISDRLRAKAAAGQAFTA
jgi:3-hydroxyacyl-CoA dehydrogenase